MRNNHFTPAADRGRQLRDEIARDYALIGLVTFVALSAILALSVVKGAENWQAVRTAELPV